MVSPSTYEASQPSLCLLSTSFTTIRPPVSSNSYVPLRSVLSSPWPLPLISPLLCLPNYYRSPPFPTLSPHRPHSDPSTRQVLILLLGNPLGLASAFSTLVLTQDLPAFPSCTTSQPDLHYSRRPVPVSSPPCLAHTASPTWYLLLMCSNPTHPSKHPYLSPEDGLHVLPFISGGVPLPTYYQDVHRCHFLAHWD